MRNLRVVLLGLTVLAARAETSFFYPVNITLGGKILWIVAGDFNNDGIGDFAVSYETNPFSYQPETGASLPETAAVVLFLGSPDGHFVRMNLPQVDPDGYDVAEAAADVNLDGKLDLILNSGVLLGKGDGTFQPLIPFDPTVIAAARPMAQSTALRPGGIALPYLPIPAGSLYQVADFNNDGIPDICFLASAVQLGRGDGTFGPPITVPPLFQPSPFPFPIEELAVFALGDFDGDGVVDIAYSSTDGGVLILFGNGDGTFTRSGGADGGALPRSDDRGRPARRRRGGPR